MAIFSDAQPAPTPAQPLPQAVTFAGFPWFGEVITELRERIGECVFHTLSISIGEQDDTVAWAVALVDRLGAMVAPPRADGTKSGDDLDWSAYTWYVLLPGRGALAALLVEEMARRCGGGRLHIVDVRPVRMSVPLRYRIAGIV